MVEKDSFDHVVKTTAQWESQSFEYWIIPRGVLCVELTPDKKTKIKIGEGNKIYSQLPYINSETDLSDYYTKEEIDNILAMLNFVAIPSSEIYPSKEALPQTGNRQGDLRFVLNTTGGDPYEYLWFDNKWISLGGDLSEYAKKSEVNPRLNALELKAHTHVNKNVLDRLTANVIDDSHKHANKNILDATTASYTTQDKATLDELAAITVFEGATKTEDGTMGYVPAPLQGQHTYFLKGDGTWAYLDPGDKYKAGEGIYILSGEVTAQTFPFKLYAKGGYVKQYIIYGAPGGVGDYNSTSGKYHIPIQVSAEGHTSITTVVQIRDPLYENDWINYETQEYCVSKTNLTNTFQNLMAINEMSGIDVNGNFNKPPGRWPQFALSDYYEIEADAQYELPAMSNFDDANFYQYANVNMYDENKNRTRTILRGQNAKVIITPLPGEKYLRIASSVTINWGTGVHRFVDPLLYRLKEVITPVPSPLQQIQLIPNAINTIDVLTTTKPLDVYMETYIPEEPDPEDPLSGYSGIIYNDGVLDVTQEDPNNLNELTVHFRENVEKTLTIPTYELPIASDTTLGGIKVGNNLTIDEDGVLSGKSGDKYKAGEGITILSGEVISDTFPFEIFPKAATVTQYVIYGTASGVGNLVSGHYEVPIKVSAPGYSDIIQTISLSDPLYDGDYIDFQKQVFAHYRTEVTNQITTDPAYSYKKAIYSDGVIRELDPGAYGDIPRVSRVYELMSGATYELTPWNVDGYSYFNRFRVGQYLNIYDANMNITRTLYQEHLGNTLIIVGENEKYMRMTVRQWADGNVLTYQHLYRLYPIETPCALQALTLHPGVVNTVDVLTTNKPNEIYVEVVPPDDEDTDPDDPMSDYTGIIYNDGVLDVTQEDPNALNELTFHFRDNVDKTITIPSTPLPIASDTTLGGIKVGANLTIDPETGVLDATGGGTTYVEGDGIEFGRPILETYQVLDKIRKPSGTTLTTDVMPSGTVDFFCDLKYYKYAGGASFLILCYDGERGSFCYTPPVTNSSNRTRMWIYTGHEQWYDLYLYDSVQSSNPITVHLRWGNTMSISFDHTTRSAQNTPGVLPGHNRFRFDSSSDADLYWAKFYENSALVGELVPVIRQSDNVVGMFNKVTETFSTVSGLSAGTPTGETIVVYDSSSTQNIPINAKLGNGLHFDANGAIEADGGGGTEYAASDGIKIESNVIKHTNSITTAASVFKKISYDAQGHITGTTNVTKSDIPALDYVPTSMLTVTKNTNVGITPSSNVFGYVSGLTAAAWNFQQTDGTLFSQYYNDSWQTEIYMDYRTGQMSTRGKNNGTWQDWRIHLDSGNYTSYTVTKTGGGASGTWGISITGNAATATTASKLGSSTVGSGSRPIYLNAGTATQCDTPASGAYWTGVPYVGSNGVMEIGKYIDFHGTNTSTVDYDYRIQAGSTWLDLVSPTTKNTITVVSPDYSVIQFQTTKTSYTITQPVIYAYPLTTSGLAVLFQSGGNTVIGGGESASMLYTNNYDSMTTAENESLYLAADSSEIHLITNAQSYSARKVLKVADGQLVKSGGIWISARDNAPVYTNKPNTQDGGYYPAWFAKTKSGGWSMGVISTQDNLYITYTTDTDYSGGTNNNTYQVQFQNKSGTVALTSDLAGYVPMETVTTDTSADTYFTKTGWVNWNRNAGTSTTNLPTANWGILLTRALPSVQVFIPDNASGLYFRRKANASTAATAWWGITGTAGNTYNLNNFISLSSISATNSGSGNAVTSISYLNGVITATKGNSFLPLSGGTMTGTITHPANTVAINLRNDGTSTWQNTIMTQSNGDEAVVFANANARTSWMFVNGEDSIAHPENNRWQSLTPALQIKGGCVAIGKLIPSGTTPTIKLDIAGSTALTGDIQLKTSGSSSDDSGDIVWYYGNGKEKMRIWTDNTYTATKGPNYRTYKSDGTAIYIGRLATLNDCVQVFYSTNYDVSQKGYYAVMTNSTSTDSSARRLPTDGQWWHVLSMSWNNGSDDQNNWVSQLALPTYQNRTNGMYWRTNAGSATALSKDEWVKVLDERNYEGSINYEKFKQAVYLTQPASPLIRGMIPTVRANRLAFFPGANTLWYTTGDWAQWSPISAFTDDQKMSLYNDTIRVNLNIGQINSAARTTTMGTRIELRNDSRDTTIDKFVFALNTGYHKVSITIYAAKNSDTDTFIKMGETLEVGTWGYQAIINTPSFRFGTATSSYGRIRIEIRYTYVDSSHKTEHVYINGIAAYSGIYWGQTLYSNMAAFDHLYSWDNSQKAIFPADVKASRFWGMLCPDSDTTRRSTANLTCQGLCAMQMFLATSSMTTGKPKGGDGYILDFDWDNTSQCKAQLAIPDTGNNGISWRGQAGSSDWSDVMSEWRTIVDSHQRYNNTTGTTEYNLTNAASYDFLLITTKPSSANFAEMTTLVPAPKSSGTYKTFVNWPGVITEASSQPTRTLGGYIRIIYTDANTCKINCVLADYYLQAGASVTSGSTSGFTVNIKRVIGMHA